MGISNQTAESEPASEPSSQSRRWSFRFSLRWFLIAAALAGIVIGVGGRRLQEYWNRPRRLVPTAFDVQSGRNIQWTAKVGTQSYIGPLVHDGQVFVGTNNGAGYLARYPSTVDLGVLLCFDASDGSFLWQASHEKLKTGRVHDWPLQGLTSSPCFERDRLWYVSNRGELVCLDTEGHRDGKDDGVPATNKTPVAKEEADVVWKYDMMKELNVSPHNCSGSSPAVLGDRVFVVTGHSVTTAHTTIGSKAPSFIALDKRTGELLWTDSSPGKNVLHGQWGSPVCGILGGVPQVIFPGGDGWLYSFDPAGTADGKSKLLWKFDCNPKTSVWKLGGAGTRNNLLAHPTIHKGLVYVAVGQDPEHGEGNGHLWCIDPTRRGDVSVELVYNKADPTTPIPHRRHQACQTDLGDYTVPNLNSAVVWLYSGTGGPNFEDKMHRSLSKVAIEGDLLFVSDFSGLFHCLDRLTGKLLWNYDLLAQCWSSPVISQDHVFICDEDGDVDAFALSGDPNIAMPKGFPVSSSNVMSSVYATPMIEENVLYLMTKDTVYAIADPPAP